ncbi:sulfurtransferase-like selenium metabolism protein YedF [Lacrimispora saccharolytica]|uniref:Selenium metabolism protein YedF n=1 Tax=Lacrimispora saccharolytica (strain ATCC 35040 / DSM 2544 / NRCC 2533 / WM1) TaxID=610130 RepID=D9R8U2_LACSW|nr:sulfurtransferase-like selenium metabolism protein YedF [Lacrimispora saccharolytica]ADL03917.1 selenium metabolism protein YedF [[Clostridium] saccharolyticum WM1]QRV21773.1 sulfurtransferase-like selenium metabolism protein YedF [Lacrimispora saccharolytica]
MEKIVDARGLACPQPVIKAKEALKGMGEGTLKVLVDNEIAVQNVMKLGNFEGLAPVSEKKGEKEFEILFHVSGTSGQVKETVLEEECIPDTRKKGLVAVLSSDQMGGGNEELGRILMKGFVYALTQLEELPETVLLYNGGARLSVEGSQSLEDLKSLEAQGVEILTCGTCLNYYGMSDQLRVGAVTNMYEIAEKMAGARLVMRP